VTRLATLVLAALVVACAPPVPEPRPNASEGTHYSLAGGGTNLLACNTWGYETVCRTSGR